MEIKEMRIKLGDTQSEFAERYDIPFRTIQNWETGMRKPPEYIVRLLEQQVENDLINRRTFVLPKEDSRKPYLPDRRNYVGSFAWLKDVQKCLGNDIVFALDDALMCQGRFGGHNYENIIWIYGDDSLKRFNGVVILGNSINECDIEEKDGIRYTNLTRTICDSFANEGILDMQGVMEAVGHYYYSNNNSMSGISVNPVYQKRLGNLVSESISYYEY